MRQLVLIYVSVGLQNSRDNCVRTGLSAVIENCHHLRHLNLAGVDHHLGDQSCFKRLHPVLNSLKGKQIVYILFDSL